MGIRPHRWATVFVILTALPGCDNVVWGGLDVRLERPSSSLEAAPAEEPDSVEQGPLALPSGPILYLARREGDRATLVPVALVGDEAGPAPLPREIGSPEYRGRFEAEKMGPGSSFTLFTEGSRVGTLAVDRPQAPDSSYCVPRPRAGGSVELVPSATAAETFLALPDGDPSDSRTVGTPRGGWEPRSSTYAQRVASLEMAGELISDRGIPWPFSVLEARKDLRIFDLAGSREPALAATFLYRDELRVAPTEEQAWAMFYVAVHDGAAYRPAYVWLRDYQEEGKGAPRYVSHFDWNGDGRPEVLMEVLGADSRWFAAAGVRAGTWQTLYQDPCGSLAATTAAAAAEAG